MLGTTRDQFSFELSFDWLANELSLFWQPFLLGCFVVASASALTGFIAIRILWRYRITQHLKLRKLRTLAKLRKLRKNKEDAKQEKSGDEPSL